MRIHLSNIVTTMSRFTTSGLDKKGKSPGGVSIPANLFQAGGKTMINALTKICKQDPENRRMTHSMDFNGTPVCRSSDLVMAPT